MVNKKKLYFNGTRLNQSESQVIKRIGLEPSGTSNGHILLLHFQTYPHNRETACKNSSSPDAKRLEFTSRYVEWTSPAPLENDSSLNESLDTHSRARSSSLVTGGSIIRQARSLWRNVLQYCLAIPFTSSIHAFSLTRLFWLAVNTGTLDEPPTPFPLLAIFSPLLEPLRPPWWSSGFSPFLRGARERSTSACHSSRTVEEAAGDGLFIVDRTMDVSIAPWRPLEYENIRVTNWNNDWRSSRDLK